MKVLVIDCWGKHSRGEAPHSCGSSAPPTGRVKANDLLELVKQWAGTVESEVVVEHQYYKDGGLDKFLWTQKDNFGLDPNVGSSSLGVREDADCR